MFTVRFFNLSMHVLYHYLTRVEKKDRFMVQNMLLSSENLIVPLDVPEEKREIYTKNYLAATKNSGNLMLFAGVQKIEHLYDDFYGDGIDGENHNPEHLFKIASSANIGVFATQVGLIARYGMDYQNIP